METDIVTLEVLTDELSADQLFVRLGLCSWTQERVCQRIKIRPQEEES
jgi:hypothetical protein